MTIDELLEKYRAEELSTHGLGTKFERLMKNFLLTYSAWRGKFSEVWLWNDFPFRDELGGKDLGIDIVAKTVDDKFWAVQCKFYAEITIVTKPVVDSFVSEATRTFDGGKTFSTFVWICTTDKYTDNALEMFKGRSVEVKKIDMERLRKEQIDWEKLDAGLSGKAARLPRELRDYQRKAVNNAREYFLTEGNTRGQLIMACGTGKTFTALKIAENLAPNGKILFLVPSISLLSQTLDEWAANSELPIKAVCVCSDTTAAKVDDEITVENLPLEAMTDAEKISKAFKKFQGNGLKIVFSTYQSIEVVHKLNETFDLVICDEAHRTVSVLNTRERQKISAQKNSVLGEHSVFTAVHDDKIIRAKRRIYMTATPKLFKTDAKKSAAEKDLTVWSMDDEKIFGKREPIFKITFAEAAVLGYLSEYKVLIFTIAETSLTEKLRRSINDKDDALKIDAALKIVGSIQALSKKLDEKSARLVLADDPNPLMHTAVAFCSSIDEAEYFKNEFPKVQEQFLADKSEAEKNSFVNIHADFVYGSRKNGKKSYSMPAAERANKLHKLKNTPIDGNACEILFNVRCLSEGVDLPALDAVIFMASKKSQVEIVQAVGRVMRMPQENSDYKKKFGYIIIPVVVPLNKSPEDALDRNEEFGDVWKIINALRAHDESMNIEIERIRNTGNSDKILIKPPQLPPSENVSDTKKPVQLTLFDFIRYEDFSAKIYARMVEHVGNRLYWIQWAHKIAEIVERHTRRITELISVEGEHKRAFDEFIFGLRKNLNPAVTTAEAVEMLAQHLSTRPVFDALFENYSFAEKNPVSQSMQKILEQLEGDGMTKDRETFERLYRHVRESCSNMGDAESRQRIINHIYNDFFQIAFKKTSEKLGIVYTPVEVVDFILRSVDAVLKKHFGRNLTDKGVHIIDPFTGTGTFITRLIQTGLIRKKDLFNKYLNELHANEIVLLAYYIAAVNIENAYHAALAAEGYAPFEGICFTDTFQLYELGQQSLPLKGVMQENSARVNAQKSTRIEVIVGNPPYSVGQTSANDNNQNQKYKKLEDRISATYAKFTDATNKNSLYDSYIKAFRWASDRIGEHGGIIGFVTNAGWLDGAAMDGLRKCFAKEFSAIYVFNLRGNARTQGELRRKESGNVFGGGSRAPVAITILVKSGTRNQEPGTSTDNSPVPSSQSLIYYRDIGDYLTREQKLDIINRTPDVLSDGFNVITPNDKADWINQRGNLFETFIPLHDLQIPLFRKTFIARSNGLKTGRDTWIYNFSRSKLEKNVQTTIEFYNSHEPTEIDPKNFVWDDLARQNKNRGVKIEFDASKIVDSMYRPFCKQNLYFDEVLNQRRYQMPKFFPTGREDNLLICVSGIGGEKELSTIITDKIIDLNALHSGTQCFPLYVYAERKQGNLFGDNHERRDGITDWILQRAREKYGDSSCKLEALSFEENSSSLKAQSSKLKAANERAITKEDIFYYVYGFLHLPAYRKDFSDELKKSLPRIILVDEPEKFWALSKAGRALAEIHLHYESQPPAEVQLEIRNEELGIEVFRVDKLRLSKDKTTLQYNEHITIKNIPPRSFDYVVNGRSPLEWIIDRYQVKTDKASRLVNDANAWGIEHDNPRYILDLILSCITVSLKTLDIVDNLPEIEFKA
ncbi:MAG: DEAD/DEAH box helicase [Selenomonadaceae bacterium]|nr:DEAD/DEAH box helicase [Selenomonadaceae bacterium]